MAQVADPGHGGPLAQHGAALPGAGNHGPVVGDREPRADARLLVDVLRAPGGDAHLLDDLTHEVGHGHGKLAVQVDPGLLPHDLDAQVALPGIVRVDDRADPVLDLRDHLAAAVVRGRVGREQDQHVDVEPDRVATDLHVPLLQYVEQADLDRLVQLGQLVDGEDPPVHARNQPEVQGLLGRHARAAGQPGRVDLADHVGKLGARRQPLRVALVPRPPRDGDVLLGGSLDQLPAGAGDRVKGVFVNRTPWQVEIGDLFVQEADQEPHQPAFGLPLLAQEEQIVPGDQAEVDLRDDGVVVSDDAGEEFLAPAEHPDEIVVDFAFDRPGDPAAGAQLPQVRRFGDRGHGAGCLPPALEEILAVPPPRSSHWGRGLA